jgi:hypothetical protein
MQRTIVTNQLLVAAVGGLLLSFSVEPTSAASMRSVPVSVLFSGRSFGVSVNLDSIPATVVCDTGHLPSNGGMLEATASDVLLDNVVSAQFMSARVRSTTAGVNSQVFTTGLSLLPGTPAAVTSSLVSSQAFASCGGTASSVSANDLVFGGTPIELTGPKQVVTIPGVATLIIHERTESITPNSTDITVNGLRLVLAAGGEIVVSSSHADVSDCANVAVHAVPWSTLKSLYR